MDIILSIKEQYFEKIFSKEKKFEYRFKFPDLNKIKNIYVYIPKTKKSIVGYLKIKKISWMDKNIASTFYAENSHNKIENNFEIMQKWMGHRKGCYVIEILSCIKFEKEIDLNLLKEKYSWTAPQNYVYVKDQELLNNLQSSKIIKE